MKFKIQIASLFVLGIIILSCTTLDPDTALIVKNQSGNFIDSTVFFINGFKHNITGIDINSTKKNEISHSLIPGNRHDIRVFVAVYLKGGKTLNSQFYNDLTGSPGKSITAIIDNSLQLTLEPEW